VEFVSFFFPSRLFLVFYVPSALWPAGEAEWMRSNQQPPPFSASLHKHRRLRQITAIASKQGEQEQMFSFFLSFSRVDNPWEKNHRVRAETPPKLARWVV